MNRKANADMTMKWIFTLIAGAIIFFFFMNVYQNYKETAEKKAVIEVTMKINNILKNAYGNPNSIFTVSMKGIKMDYDSCTKGLYVNRNPNNIIKMAPFAPSHLESTTEDYELFIMPFKYPFRIDNFVYLTSKNVAYVFFRKANGGNRIKELFNPSLGFVFPKEKLSTYSVEFDNTDLETQMTNILDDLSQSNFYRIYLIFDYDDYPNTPPSITITNPIKNALLKLKLISRESGSIGGFVQSTDLIYDDTNNQYTAMNTYALTYFDRSTLFGALMIDDPETYGCIVKKALKRYSSLLYLYKNRCDILSQAVINGDVVCSDDNLYDYCKLTNEYIHDVIINSFLDDSNAPYILIRDPQNSDPRIRDTEQALQNLYASTLQDTATSLSIASLKQLNTYAKNKNCPLIY